MNKSLGLSLVIVWLAAVAQTTLLAGVAAVGPAVPLLLVVLILLSFLVGTKSFLGLALWAGLWRDILGFALFGQWSVVYLLLFGLVVAFKHFGLQFSNRFGFGLLVTAGVVLEVGSSRAVVWVQEPTARITAGFLGELGGQLALGIILGALLWFPLKYLLEITSSEARITI